MDDQIRFKQIACSEVTSIRDGNTEDRDRRIYGLTEDGRVYQYTEKYPEATGWIPLKMRIFKADEHEKDLTK